VVAKAIVIKARYRWHLGQPADDLVVVIYGVAYIAV